jgi:hypothetical protein
MAIHTFGDYLDFHPHLQALVADGLFVRSEMFHVMPEVSPAPQEKLFPAQVINSAHYISRTPSLMRKCTPTIRWNRRPAGFMFRIDCLSSCCCGCEAKAKQAYS